MTFLSSSLKSGIRDRILRRLLFHMRCEAFLAARRGDRQWAAANRQIEEHMRKLHVGSTA